MKGAIAEEVVEEAWERGTAGLTSVRRRSGTKSGSFRSRQTSILTIPADLAASDEATSLLVM